MMRTGRCQTRPLDADVMGAQNYPKSTVMNPAPPIVATAAQPSSVDYRLIINSEILVLFRTCVETFGSSFDPRCRCFQSRLVEGQSGAVLTLRSRMPRGPRLASLR